MKGILDRLDTFREVCTLRKRLITVRIHHPLSGNLLSAALRHFGRNHIFEARLTPLVNRRVTVRLAGNHGMERNAHDPRLLAAVGMQR